MGTFDHLSKRTCIVRCVTRGFQATVKPRTPCSSTGFGGSSRNRPNLSHPSTKCLRNSRSTRLTVVHLRGRKFSFCTPSPVHLSRTSSSLVASRRVSVSSMTPWLLLLTTSTLSTTLLLAESAVAGRNFGTAGLIRMIDPGVLQDDDTASKRKGTGWHLQEVQALNG
jgi:hypothetical protein